MERTSKTDALAKKLREALSYHPDLTVEKLAEATAATQGDVRDVLDAYLVSDKKVVFAGEGRGGGWVTA